MKRYQTIDSRTRVVANQETKPTIKVMSKMDQEMQNILYTDDLTEQISTRYNDLLLKCKMLKEGREQLTPPLQQIDRQPEKPADRAPVNVPSEKRSPSGILESLLKNAKAKGRTLATHIQQYPQFQWDDIYQLNVNSTPIASFNVIDLIGDFAHQHKKDTVIRAVEFARLLEDTNVSSAAIGNINRWTIKP